MHVAFSINLFGYFQKLEAKEGGKREAEAARIAKREAEVAKVRACEELVARDEQFKATLVGVAKYAPGTREPGQRSWWRLPFTEETANACGSVAFIDAPEGRIYSVTFRSDYAGDTTTYYYPSQEAARRWCLEIARVLVITRSKARHWLARTPTCYGHEFHEIVAFTTDEEAEVLDRAAEELAAIERRREHEIAESRRQHHQQHDRETLLKFVDGVDGFRSLTFDGGNWSIEFGSEGLTKAGKPRSAIRFLLVRLRNQGLIAKVRFVP